MCSFLDYRMAFDSIPHGHLVVKVRSSGLRDTLVVWLADYLSHRNQQVVVEGAMSTTSLHWLLLVYHKPLSSSTAILYPYK